MGQREQRPWVLQETTSALEPENVAGSCTRGRWCGHDGNTGPQHLASQRTKQVHKQAACDFHRRPGGGHQVGDDSLHLTEEDTGWKRLGDLLKVTQPGSDRAGTLTQGF